MTYSPDPTPDPGADEALEPDNVVRQQQDHDADGRATESEDGPTGDSDECDRR